MKPLALLIFAGAVSTMAASVGYRIGQHSARASVAPIASKTAALAQIYNLTLPDLKGQAQSLKQWQGKVLVVNYWATWCPPCREEMPGFSRLQDKLAAKGVQFVGISIDTVDKVKEFQQETPVNYPLLMGEFGAMQTSIELGNDRQAMPFTAVIDRQGRTAYVKLGRLAETDLEKQLEKLIAQ